MTNRYLLDCSTEVYFFQATVAGNQIPDVTCHSTLKASNPPTTQQPTQPPQTTQNPETTQAPATTQQPPTTMEPGTTFLSYLVVSFIFESAVIVRPLSRNTSSYHKIQIILFHSFADITVIFVVFVFTVCFFFFFCSTIFSENETYKLMDRSRRYSVRRHVQVRSSV